MLLCEIASKVERHIDESEIASRALKAFRADFARYDDFQSRYRLADFPDLVIFTKNELRKTSMGMDSAGYMNRPSPSVIGLYFRVPKTFEEAKKLILSDREFELTFRHEFQHYLDERERRYSKEPQPKSANEYANSAVEYPAFFKEAAEPLLAILRAAKAGQDLSGLKKIEPDFSKFIRGGQHFSFTEFNYKNFTPETRRRWLRDMAAVHKAVVAIEGATGKFKPSLIARILIWLQDRFGIKV